MYEDFDEINFKQKIKTSVWKQLLIKVKPHRKYVILALIAAIVSSFAETYFIKFIAEDGIQKFLEQNNLQGLSSFFIWMGVFIIGYGIIIMMYVLYSARIERKIYADLTEQSFCHLQSQSYSFFDKYSVGWLISRTMNDTSRVSEIISWGLSDIVTSVFKLFFILIVMLMIDIPLTLIMMIIVPTVLLIGILFRRVIIRYSWKVRRINAAVSGAFNEGIMGAKTSKSLVLEEKNNQSFNRLVGKFKKTSIKSAIYSSLYYQVIAIVTALGIAAMTYYGGLKVFNNELDPAKLFIFVSYTTMFFEPVLGIARVTNEMKHAQVAAERVFNILAVKPAIIDSPAVIEKYGDYDHPLKENWEALHGEVSFKNVTFSYGNDIVVLKNFSLDVKQGQTIALVGETGAGKSTIVNLLCRFYEPTQGQILIDGRDYKERSVAWLHANLGYVMQTPHLFSGTVKENIRYGRLTATDEEVVAAAQTANAHDFIMQLEQGYDTEVGEGGNRLSQGQKQLISFARAVVANPRILVLDEATSSIDTETEAVIQKAIHNILHNRTSFVVAHRLSTITHADLILVVRNGEVIEQGAHAELMKKKGYYYKLYANQFIDEKLKELDLF